MTDKPADPAALVPTDPAPAAPLDARQQRELDRQARHAEARRQQEAALAKAKDAQPAKPDPELAQLGAVARATCGCQACTGRVRHGQGTRTHTRVDGAPSSCGMAVILAELIARAK